MNHSSTARQAHRIVVREVQCKTILNRCSIGDYSLNCYTGCEHGCVYCYARFMQRFHPHPELWGQFVDVKTNAVEALRRQLRRAKPGEVFVSSACDGWQPIEAKCGLTLRCCRLLTDYGFQVNVLTKSALLLRDLEQLASPNIRIGITVTTLNERLGRLWEPRSSSIEARFRIIQEAQRLGLRTAVMFAPLLPFLSDSQESIDCLFERAADLAIDEVWVDALNPRPKVWPSVAKLLGEKFPDLRDRYRRILFQHEARTQYLDRLRDRVAGASRKVSLKDRIAVCF
jgi:DNA repair photolyase